MRFYFLAFIVWVCIIVLWISIIGIPICVYLCHHNNWFDAPFDKAYSKAKENEKW